MSKQHTQAPLRATGSLKSKGCCFSVSKKRAQLSISLFNPVWFFLDMAFYYMTGTNISILINISDRKLWQSGSFAFHCNGLKLLQPTIFEQHTITYVIEIAYGNSKNRDLVRKKSKRKFSTAVRPERDLVLVTGGSVLAVCSSCRCPLGSDLTTHVNSPGKMYSSVNTLWKSLEGEVSRKFCIVHAVQTGQRRT